MCLQMKTAMGEDQKIRCLSNDMIRRLSNTSELMDDQARWDVIDEYAQELCNSGYGRGQIKRRIIAGIKGYEKKMEESRRPGGRSLHR